jgi:hypothetical protein
MAVRNWSSGRRWVAVLGPLLVVGGLCGLLLIKLRSPYPWIGALLGGWCLWAGFVCRSWGRWGLNGAVILFTLGIAELLLQSRKSRQVEYVCLNTPKRSYHVQDDLLGVAPRPNCQVRHRRQERGQTILDAVYTIDTDRLRVVVPAGDPALETVVFCGCSFTFGEGVADDETLPSRVAQLRPDLRVLNLGFHGYGPHQMLANLESGRLAQLCQKPPRVIIFQMISDHVYRVVGWVPYNRHAPQYGWREGRIERLGHLDDHKLSQHLRFALMKSNVLGKLLMPHLMTAADIELTAAVVAQAKAEVNRQFPECEFHVVYWGYTGGSNTPALRLALQRHDLNLHVVEELDPRLAKPGVFIRGDGHPTPETYARLAACIEDTILVPALGPPPEDLTR